MRRVRSARREARSRRPAAAALMLALAMLPAAGRGESREPASPPSRLVVVKVDGLSQALVDRFVDREDPRTGRSVLPWIRHLFYDSGVRVENFYARGASLSQPSWAILDTGRESLVKGNFELDRRTGQYSDHLNLAAYYFDVTVGRKVYGDAVAALDAAEMPLLSDAFRYEERETGIQLLRRGTKFFDLLKIGLDPLSGSVADRVGDMVVGVDFKNAFRKTTREQFLAGVRDPSLRYVDLYFPTLDESVHDDPSEAAALEELRELDRTIGEAHAALVESGTADRTVLVVVSDHGLTVDPRGAYSQGVNLVSYLSKPELGAHHVLTRAAPLSAYGLDGSLLKPSTQAPVVTPSQHSLYLRKRPDQVTCAMDFDGNERAQLHFRDPDLNRLEMLAAAMRGTGLDGPGRAAAGRAALAVLDRRRAGWRAEAASIREELAALGALRAEWEREAARHRSWLAHTERARGLPGAPAEAPLAPYGGLSRLNKLDRASDVEQRTNELRAALWRLERDVADFGAYCDALELRAGIDSVEALLAAPAERLFGPRDLGANLTVLDLLAYPVGLEGIVLDASGQLDVSRSFATVDYFRGLGAIRVRNSARAELGTRPVAYSVARLPLDGARRAAVASGALSPEEAASVTAALYVHGSERAALLHLERAAAGREPEIMLVPVACLRADPAAPGAIGFEREPWRSGLPFALFEDPALAIASGDRTAWLSGFHTRLEWFAATHATREGLSVTGLSEEFSRRYREAFAAAIARQPSRDLRLARRLELRKRDGMEFDMFVCAAPHWNFDLKDFNPGGNHGSFRRESMRAVLWMRGGAATRVHAGPLVVSEPYDGLDFAPTALEAAGVTTDGAVPPSLARGGFSPFPGRIVWGALADTRGN